MILAGIQRGLFYVVREAIRKARYVLTSDNKVHIVLLKWYWHSD